MKVLFIDGTAGFTPYRLTTKACGGISTSLTFIPRFLAKNGVKVVVASEHSVREEVEGVLYTPTIEEADKSADVVVFNRNIFNKQMEGMFPRSKKVWWLHDIVDPRYMEDDSYLKMDKIVALSKYNQDSYTDFFGIPSGKFRIIPNGVDKKVFYPGRTHNKHLFICASAPIKGLYPMQFCYHNMKRFDPEVELRIYSDQKLHDQKNTTQIQTQLDALGKMGVKILDPIPQSELADVLRDARAMLMPNHYPEICSNLILQAQACGTPVVTTAIGSAVEYIRHEQTGMLTQLAPHDMYWWWKDFTEQVMRIMQSDNLYKKIHDNAPEDVWSWDEVGVKWLAMLKELL